MIHLRKKHFEFLADSLVRARQRADTPADVAGVDLVIQTLAEDLASTSTTFDPARFQDRCQYGQMVLPLR